MAGQATHVDAGDQKEVGTCTHTVPGVGKVPKDPSQNVFPDSEEEVMAHAICMIKVAPLIHGLEHI